MHTLNTQIVQMCSNDGGSYFAADIPHGFVQPWLDFLKLSIGEEKYNIYTKNQQARDNSTFHMTVVRPKEYKKLKSKVVPFLHYPINLKSFGIGHVTDGDNEVYFLVCECSEANNIREYLDLPTYYLHVTLGFKVSDIFNTPKHRETLIFPYNVVERGHMHKV